MSLINDALKRARESQQKNPPSGGPPLRPVEIRRPRRDVNWIFPALAILLIVAACFFLGLAMTNRTVTKIVNVPDVVVTQQVDTVVAPEPPPETNAPVAPAPDLPTVQGIFYDPVNPSAIMDGRSVSIGSRVGDWRVKEISKYAVTLEGTNGLLQKINLGD